MTKTVVEAGRLQLKSRKQKIKISRKQKKDKVIKFIFIRKENDQMGREEETNEERQSSALIFLVLWRLLLSDQESNKNGIQYTKPLYFPSLFVSSRKKV